MPSIQESDNRVEPPTRVQLPARANPCGSGEGEKMKLRSVLLGGTLILFCLAFLLPASAQRTEGSLVGTVTDPKDAAVVDARVVVRSLATGEEFEYRTDEIGFFRAPSLRVGDYQVTVEAPGFKKAVVSNVHVVVNSTAGVEIGLEIGAIEQVITVEGGQTLVQTEEARLADTLTSR